MLNIRQNYLNKSFIQKSILNIIDLPVVNREWLLKCYEMEKRLPLRKYLIGDAIVPVDDIYEMCEEAEAPPPIPDPIPSNGNKKNQFYLFPLLI